MSVFMTVQFSSVAQSCPTLCNPMNCSTPGLPVHHQLPEFTQTHIHRVSDAIQPSHPLSSPSPPAPNPFQHQILFQWVNSSHHTNYCIFVICFDIRMCDISSSILSQEYFGYLGPFVIPYEFYCFFSFCKNVIGILLGMHWNRRSLWGVCSLTILNLSIHEYGCLSLYLYLL